MAAFGGLKGTLTASATSVTNPFAATGSVSVAVGDLLIFVASERNVNTSGTVTDNLGHTYAAQNAGSVSTGGGRAFWVIATSAGTLTSISSTFTASSSDVAVIGAVFEGPFDASPLDKNPANGTVSTSTSTCPSTGTLSQADELVIAWSAGASGRTASATSPNLLALSRISAGEGGANSIGAALGYQVVSATTAVVPVFTYAGTVTGVNGTMSFKKSTGAAFNTKPTMFLVF